MNFPHFSPDVLSKLSEGQVKKSLRNSICDGSAYSVMLGLTQNYITPYELTMKATIQQIGLLTSVWTVPEAISPESVSTEVSTVITDLGPKGDQIHTSGGKPS